MNLPTDNLPASHLPRMANAVPLRVQFFNSKNGNLPIILMVIESVNGTFTFHMPPEYASMQLIPAIDHAVVLGGGKSVLAGANGLVTATVNDLRNIERRGQ